MSDKTLEHQADSISIEIQNQSSSTPEPGGVSSDFDESYAAYKGLDAREIDPTEAKRVLRKIDLRVIPVLFGTYLLQYLDKNALNFASAYGLSEGTHLVGQDYSWLGSIFYFGYLIDQYPAGYLLQRFPIAKFLSFSTLAWGIILITTPACTSFAGIATNRFLLGFVEAAVNPGMSHIRT